METKNLFTAYKNVTLGTTAFFDEMNSEIKAALGRYDDLTNTPGMLYSSKRQEAENACFKAAKDYGIEIPNTCGWRKALDSALNKLWGLQINLTAAREYLEKTGSVDDDDIRNVYLNAVLRRAKEMGGERLARVWRQSVDNTIGSVDEMIK